MKDLLALIHDKIPNVRKVEEYAVSELRKLLKNDPEFATATWTVIGYSEDVYPFGWATLVDLESPQIAFRVRTVASYQNSSDPSRLDVCFLEAGVQVGEWSELPLRNIGMKTIAELAGFRSAYAASLGFKTLLNSSTNESTTADD